MSTRPRRAPAAHVPHPNPDVPNTCRCGLRLDLPNARHEPMPPNPGAELDARRLGERDNTDTTLPVDTYLQNERTRYP